MPEVRVLDRSRFILHIPVKYALLIAPMRAWSNSLAPHYLIFHNHLLH